MNHPFTDIRRILVIKLRHIGDVLLTSPVFRALKETFPEAEVSVLVNGGTEEVLSGNPFIKEIITFDREIKKAPFVERYKEEIRFLREIRKRSFDMTVDLTGGDRAAILSFLSGARYRIGWESRKGLIGKRHLYTHLFRPDGRRHMVLQNLDVVRHFGIDTEDRSVNFFIPDDARAFVKEIFKKNNLQSSSWLGGTSARLGAGLQPIVHIHPTSRWLFKCWKDEYMAEIIRWLIDNNAIVIVTSSPDRREMEKTKKILSLLRDSPDSIFSPVNLRQPPSPITHHPSRIIDLCGKTTIKQLAAISEASDLFLGVDSAPMHIAAAVGTPVIALFGPTGAYSWGPWDNSDGGRSKVNGLRSKHIVIQRDWECVPCGKDGCNGTKISRCLEDIRPDEVIAHLSLHLHYISGRIDKICYR
ncbi:MAG: putative lipopolysaccharide heptosyltransferase III [Thermodesulfovibrionales bacterium]